MPVAPSETWVPTDAIVATAWCTARPMNTHAAIQAATSRSLRIWAVSRAGVVAYGMKRDFMLRSQHNADAADS